MKFSTLLQHLPHRHRTSSDDVSNEPVKHPASGAPARSQPARWLAQQGAMLRRRFQTRAAVSATPPVLSLDTAAHILETLRQQPSTPERSALQRQAFARLYAFLQEQPVAQHADTLQPLLILMASCLARLPDLEQRSQALNLIEMTLQHTPQLILAEALTTQLWGLSSSLKPRAFDAIAQFLQQEGADPRSHIDILLELADVMQVPSCRQRAGALVEAGLQRLEDAPELCARIASRLTLSTLREVSGRRLRFGL